LGALDVVLDRALGQAEDARDPRVGAFSSLRTPTRVAPRMPSIAGGEARKLGPATSGQLQALKRERTTRAVSLLETQAMLH
jgi:hypothetical protein